MADLENANRIIETDPSAYSVGVGFGRTVFAYANESGVELDTDILTTLRINIEGARNHHSAREDIDPTNPAFMLGVMVGTLELVPLPVRSVEEGEENV